MRLFGFGSKRKNEANTVEMPMAMPSEPQEEVLKSETAESKSDNPQEAGFKKPLTVSYATGWPIDVVYGYLHKNYEDKGFQDAMLNENIAFRDMNKSLIRNKILMVFREINLKYDAMVQDLQSRIDNCNSVGLLTTVAQLENSKGIIDVHKEELRQLEEQFRSNDSASIPLQSYECGFLRGIAATTLGDRNAEKTAVSTEMKSFGKVTA